MQMLQSDWLETLYTMNRPIPMYQNQIQPKIIHLSTRLWERLQSLWSLFSPRSLVLRSVVLDWILMSGYSISEPLPRWFWVEEWFFSHVRSQPIVIHTFQDIDTATRNYYRDMVDKWNINSITKENATQLHPRPTWTPANAVEVSSLNISRHF